MWARDGVSLISLCTAPIEPQIHSDACLRCSPETRGKPAVSMSLVLTSGASRPPVVEVVDLTETPPPSPPSLGYIASGSRNGISQPLLEIQRQQHDRVFANEEPPFKKRRVDLSWAEKQTIACQQVSPYVSRGLADLSSSEYIIDEIAIRVWDI